MPNMQKAGPREGSGLAGSSRQIFFVTADPSTILKVRAALRGHRGRSSLYRWFWENYGSVADARQKGVRSEWLDIARELDALGIKGRGGKKLKAETVKRVFYRVAKDVGKAGIAPRRPVQPPIPTPAPSAHSQQDEDHPGIDPTPVYFALIGAKK